VLPPLSTAQTCIIPSGQSRGGSTSPPLPFLPPPPLSPPPFSFDVSHPKLCTPASSFHPHRLATDIRTVLGGAGTKCAATIIYCVTRKQTEEMARAVSRVCGVECGVYHAGLPQFQRGHVHDKFLRDELQVVSATIAFGMGIDKPDVRCVIHYGLPKVRMRDRVETRSAAVLLGFQPSTLSLSHRGPEY
jgi:hypothetical protein